MVKLMIATERLKGRKVLCVVKSKVKELEIKCYAFRSYRERERLESEGSKRLSSL